MRATFRDGTDFDDVLKRIGDRLMLLRHDTCGAADLRPALRFAAMEAERGVRATYFIWNDLLSFGTAECDGHVRRLRAMNMGLGLHYSAIPHYLRDGVPPSVTIGKALDFLRLSGEVTLAAGHGDPTAYTLQHRPYEVFAQYDAARNEGSRTRWPFPLLDLAQLGLVETYLHGEHTVYLSDSRGMWNSWCGDPRPRPFERMNPNPGLSILDDLPSDARVQVLLHPVHWTVR